MSVLGFDLWTLLLWAVGLIVLLRLIVLAMMFQNLVRTRLQAPGYWRAKASEVPDHLVSMLLEEADPLLDLGLEPAGFVRARPFTASSDPVEFELLLRDPESGGYALLAPSETPEPHRRTALTFHTFFDDGTSLLTLNGARWSIIDRMPDTELLDPCVQSPAEQRQAHLRRVRELTRQKGVRSMKPREYLQAASRGLEAYVAHLLQKGLIQRNPQRPGIYMLNTWAAVRAAVKMAGGRRRFRNWRAQGQIEARKHPESLRPVPVEELVSAYRRRQELRNNSPKRQWLGWVLPATGGLFALSMLSYFSFQDVAMVVMVVLIHELGHLLAMKAFGYRNTRIFFIPFFGAAAMGSKRNVTVGQEVTILLAGPLPGLLLALALRLFLSGSAPFIPDFVAGYPALALLHLKLSALAEPFIWFLVGINLFNLLPIFPLDGGRIVHLLLFSGAPRLEAAFKAFAVVLFGAFGLLTGEIVLLVLAGLVAWNIPGGLRKSRLEAEMRSESPQSEENRLQRIFALLEKLPKPLSLTQKIALAQQLEERLSPARPGLAAIPWLAVYLASFLLGVFPMLV